MPRRSSSPDTSSSTLLHGRHGHGEEPLQRTPSEQPHEHERDEPRRQHHGQQPTTETVRRRRKGRRSHGDTRTAQEQPGSGTTK